MPKYNVGYQENGRNIWIIISAESPEEALSILYKNRKEKEND